jgi:hypothetical protein
MPRHLVGDRDASSLVIRDNHFWMGRPARARLSAEDAKGG